MHRAGLKRIEQHIAQRSALDLRALAGTGHLANMIVKNFSGSICEAKTIEVGSVIPPEGIDQAGSFERG